MASSQRSVPRWSPTPARPLQLPQLPHRRRRTPVGCDSSSADSVRPIDVTTNLLQAFDAQLASYHALTTRALIDALPSREPRRYLYDLVTTQLARGGKGLRPALCIASCRAFGGSVEKVMESAAAIELLHNA